MSEPMSKEAMLAALRDVRLPPATEGETVTDLLAVLGLAGLCLLLLALGVHLVSTRRGAVAVPSLSEEVAALARTAEPDRRVALLHLLKARQIDRFEALRAKLYRPDAPLSSDEIAAELLRD